MDLFKLLSYVLFYGRFWFFHGWGFSWTGFRNRYAVCGLSLSMFWNRLQEGSSEHLDFVLDSKSERCLLQWKAKCWRWQTPHGNLPKTSQISCFNCWIKKLNIVLVNLIIYTKIIFSKKNGSFFSMVIKGAKIKKILN